MSAVYAKYGYPERSTIGWEPGCSCFGSFEKRVVEEEVPVLLKNVQDTEKKSVTQKDLTKSTLRPLKFTGETRPSGIMRTVYIPSIPLEDHPIIPCTVLDPFCGSGTVSAVSLAKGLRSIGIDLSEVYLRKNAIPRIEGILLSRPALARLAPQREGVGKAGAEGATGGGARVLGEVVSS